jgi:uncharacterized repeat protein (TIGR01451 family)
VVVRNPLPANARFVRATPEPSAVEPDLRWHLGTLDGCTHREIVLVLLPTGEGDVKNCARVQFEHGECVCTKVGNPVPPPAPGPAPAIPAPPPAQPQLGLRKVGPAQALLYKAMMYELVVTNSGTSPATDVVLTDTLPKGMGYLSTAQPDEPAYDKDMHKLTWKLGTLAPGQSRTLKYQVNGREAGQHCNRAVVTAAGNVSQEASSCVTVAEAKLKVSKAGPEQNSVRRPATYHLTVSNEGTVPITNLTLVDVLSAKVSFVSATANGRFVEERKEVQWPLGTLPPGARQNVQVVLQAREPGEVVNTALARADGDLQDTAEVRTVFEGAAGLTVDVEVRDNPVEVGTATRYTITAVNQGSSPATDIIIAATIPEHMEMQGAQGPTKFGQEGQRLVFEPLANLPAGGQAAYVVDVLPKRAGADVIFKVEMAAKELTAGPVRREVHSNVYEDPMRRRPVEVPPPGPP